MLKQLSITTIALTILSPGVAIAEEPPCVPYDDSPSGWVCHLGEALFPEDAIKSTQDDKCRTPQKVSIPGGITAWGCPDLTIEPEQELKKPATVHRCKGTRSTRC